MFSITGHYVLMVTGKIEQGILHTGDEIEIIGADAEDDVYWCGDVPQVA
ncbi:MAG: hypothetical protein M9952_15620 [Microthrixaceae bacterium]|nr:hypothetical protein [Microthrixaceae bacterium]